MFEETQTKDARGMKKFKYEQNRTDVSGKRCLGVKDNCDEKLFLLNSTSTDDHKDRRCSFRKL